MFADGAAGRRYGWLVVRYAVAALLLIGVFYAVPLEPALRVLRSTSLTWFAAALLLLSASRWLGAVRTHTLASLHEIKLSVGRLFEISCVSTLYAVALPGNMSGGIVRWYRIGGPQRNHSAAAVVVIVERLVDYALLALLGVLGWFADALARESTATAWWLLALAAATFMVLCAVSLSGALERTLRWLAARPEPGGVHAARGASVVRRLVDALTRQRDARSLLRAAALSLAAHLVATLAVYMLARAVEIDISFATALWLRACTIAMTAAALTPAGLGVRELGTVLLLGLVGIEPAQALALSLLQLTALLFFAAVGGLFEARRYLLPEGSQPLAENDSARAERDVPCR